MKAIDLWDSFGGLDPDLLERSEHKRSRIIPWRPLAAAACTVLVLLGVPVLYFATLGQAGSSAPATDAKYASFMAEGEAAPNCMEVTTAAPMETEAAYPGYTLFFNETGLASNDAGSAPAPYPRRDLTEEEAAAVYPAAYWGYVLYEEPDGEVISLRVDIDTAAIAGNFHLVLAPGSTPTFENATPSYVGDMTVWASYIAVRAPGGTAKNYELRFDWGGNACTLFCKAAPGETEDCEAALLDLLCDLAASPAPDLSVYGKEAQQ